MTGKQKFSIVIILAVGVGIVGFLFLNKAPPADPTADRIAFIARSSFPGLLALSLTENIYVINVDTPGLTRVVQPSNLQWGLTWSDQGDKIAYYEYDTEGLYIMNADGSGDPQLLWSGTPGLDAMNISWSPDGTKIAFSNNTAIHLLDLTTKQTDQITDGTIPSIEPTWSPDGNRLTFTLAPSLKIDEETASSIGIINIDGTGFIQITPDDGSRTPAWSPDGNQIAFQRNGDIYVMNVDGTNVRALTQDEKNFFPAWSSDGTRIAFVSLRNSKCGPSFADGLPFCTSELYVMNSDGSNKVLVRSKKIEYIRDPVWAPRN